MISAAGMMLEIGNLAVEAQDAKTKTIAPSIKFFKLFIVGSLKSSDVRFLLSHAFTESDVYYIGWKRY